MKSIHEHVKGNGNKIVVGEYEIRELEDGDFWIEHESGEGTQVRVEDMHEAINDLYNKVF